MYPSKRSIVYSKNGMVATSQSLAAQAGLDVLRRGGNAIDAAIATAMTLTVTEPCSNGIGGDAFAIVWYEGKLYGVNASGASPALISRDKLVAMGYDKMPVFGATPVNVPGIPGMWAALNKRFSKKSMETLSESAVGYAEDGFAVSPTVAKLWEEGKQRYEKLGNLPGVDEWMRTYTKDGRAPKAGEIFRLPDHAKTLRTIAKTNAGDFYRGELADRISAHFEKIGGFLRKSDLEDFAVEFVEPIHINYRGKDIWELPPNGQGIVALMALNILKGFTFSERDSVETLHLQLEAMKLAFADAMRYVTDPRYMDVATDELLSESFAAERRKRITDRAEIYAPADLKGTSTVYLCAADCDGNMVSYIQSNYMGFGSGIVVPGTGIAMHNRGADFSLDPNSFNCIAPKKKTYHTIIPGFMTENGKPVGPFGMMGGYMQPQGHVQMVMNMLDFGLDVQDSLNAPRWQWQKGNSFSFEPEYDDALIAALKARGHDAFKSDLYLKNGRGQSIFLTPEGSYMGATEPRADGVVAAY